MVLLAHQISANYFSCIKKECSQTRTELLSVKVGKNFALTEMQASLKAFLDDFLEHSWAASLGDSFEGYFKLLKLKIRTFILIQKKLRRAWNVLSNSDQKKNSQQFCSNIHCLMRTNHWFVASVSLMNIFCDWNAPNLQRFCCSSPDYHQIRIKLIHLSDQVSPIQWNRRTFLLPADTIDATLEFDWNSIWLIELFFITAGKLLSQLIGSGY